MECWNGAVGGTREGMTIDFPLPSLGGNGMVAHVREASEPNQRRKSVNVGFPSRQVGMGLASRTRPQSA